MGLSRSRVEISSLDRHSFAFNPREEISMNEIACLHMQPKNKKLLAAEVVAKLGCMKVSDVR